ncbi:MAG: RHS repeat-associated core domain-containing protein, partial [Gammaproteobacteria bacterium]|nr:RHS repeat-associated core domain-containing protein [Gammaproteobacteria bacterium]
PHAVSSTTYSYSCNCTSSGSGSGCYGGGGTTCSTCTNTTNYSYDAAGNMLTRSGYAGNRWVTWTAFSKPKQISVGVSGCTGDCTTFTYGPDRQLVRQVDKKGGTTRTVYYIGPHFEVEVIGAVTEYRSHALANGRVVYTQVEDTNGIGWQAYYPLRDHLGSVDKQYVAMGAGTNPLVYSYDAHGRRRNADWNNDGSGSQMTPTLWNRRGYTDHEMLDTAQLVHMQGRVYDPTLGRFLSPDPVLGRLGSPQSLNPYSYVENNPLAFVDPSGFATIPVTGEIIVATTPYHPPCPAVLCGIYEGQLIGVDPPTAFPRHGVQEGVGSMLDYPAEAIANRYSAYANWWVQKARSQGGVGQGTQSAPAATDDNGQNSPDEILVTTPHVADGTAMSAGVAEFANVFDGQWLGNNGKWNSLSWGGNQWTGARSIALSNAEFWRAVTKGAFVVSAGVSVLDGIGAAGRGDGFGVAKAGSNISWAAAGTWGGPAGWAGASTYTLTSWALESPTVYDVVITAPLDRVCARLSGC